MKDLRFSGSGFSPLILYWILVFSFENERALLFFSLCAPLPFVKETKAKKMIMMREKGKNKKEEITLTSTLIPLCGSFAGMLSVGVDSRYWYFLLLIRAERKISLSFFLLYRVTIEIQCESTNRRRGDDFGRSQANTEGKKEWKKRRRRRNFTQQRKRNGKKETRRDEMNVCAILRTSIFYECMDKTSRQRIVSQSICETSTF